MSNEGIPYKGAALYEPYVTSHAWYIERSSNGNLRGVLLAVHVHHLAVFDA